MDICVRFRIDEKKYIAVIKVGLFRSNAKIYESNEAEAIYIRGETTAIYDWAKWKLIKRPYRKVRYRIIKNLKSKRKSKSKSAVRQH